jgi:hypothetical protein
MNLPNPSEQLLELISSLEISLHQPAVRCDTGRLQALLHPDFVEVGRSGQSYNKGQMVQHLVQESLSTAIWSQDFKLVMPAFSVALLTYQSAHIGTEGQLTHHAARSSLWQFTDMGWQLRFHQGTPVAAFIPNDNQTALLVQQHTH